LHTVPNTITFLSTKNYQNWLNDVEDIASQSRVVFETVYSMTEKTQFLECMIPQVVQRHKLEEVGQQITIWIAYSFSNICSKNYQNRLMCVEVIVCNVSVVFFEAVYIGHVYRSVS